MNANFLAVRGMPIKPQTSIDNKVQSFRPRFMSAVCHIMFQKLSTNEIVIRKSISMAFCLLSFHNHNDFPCTLSSNLLASVVAAVAAAAVAAAAVVVVEY